MFPDEQVVAMIAAILVTSRTQGGASYDQAGVAEEAWDLWTAVIEERDRRKAATESDGR